jgi:hypothetical protein
MTAKLDILLGNLHSDENRLRFLREIYTPGNAEVADRILAIEPDTSVLEKEAGYSREHGETERFSLLAKRFVDHYIQNGWDILLKKSVVRWGDRNLADYAVSKLEEKGEESTLEYAGDIAQSLGQEQKARQLLERVLALQMKKKDDYAFSPAGTCVKLGRFNEAIDLFMRSGYHWLDRALHVAKEHVPQRVNEVAQIGFDRYAPSFHTQETYVECAEVLGKVDKAKNTLSREARKLTPDGPPRLYGGLVKSLVKLGMNNDAKTVVQKVADYHFKESRERENMMHVTFHDDSKELAELYEIIGEQAPVRDLLLARIDAGLNNGWHPSHYDKDIERGYQLTGDKAFLERKLRLFEKEQKYDEASKLVMELGKPELAESYRAMHEMVQSVRHREPEAHTSLPEELRGQIEAVR